MPSILDIKSASARAQRVRLRSALPFMLVMAFSFALVPFGIQAESGSTSGNDLPYTLSLNLERSEAHAIEPGNTAYQFLGEMANAAGMPASELIITTTGIASVTTGMILATEAGQDWGASAATALNNIVESADYPDWETLDSATQSTWGTKENYDAAKYVSLMNAFGFETEYERFETAQGSGGGNFEFQDDIKDKLKQFYRIGSLWKSHLGVMFGDLEKLISGKEAIQDFLGVQGAGNLDGSQVQGLPNDLHVTFDYVVGTNIHGTGYTANNTKNEYFLITGREVYIIVDRSIQDNSNNRITYMLFSKDSFLWDNSSTDYGTPDTQAMYRSGEKPYYYRVLRRTQGLYSNGFECNVTFNNLSRDTLSSEEYLIMESILYGGSTSTNVESNLVDYPDGDISNNQRIYYPEDGVNPNTTWQQFTTPQTPVRDNTTPFNPDNDSQSVNWQTDVEENLLTLEQFPLNKLFPFSLLYDITLLANKVKAVTVEQQVSGTYKVISIPINIPLLPGEPGTLQIDLSNLYDLLVGTRIFIQILLATSLLFATIRLWSGILGGQ